MTTDTTDQETPPWLRPDFVPVPADIHSERRRRAYLNPPPSTPETRQRFCAEAKAMHLGFLEDVWAHDGPEAFTDALLNHLATIAGLATAALGTDRAAAAFRLTGQLIQKAES